MYKIDTSIPDDVKMKLPEPSGYTLLVAMPVLEDKTDGGVILPDGMKHAEETASILGAVLKLGPDAYADSDKFPSGPYCKEGDFVIFRSYSGTRFKLGDQEFRLINDDTVEAVVEDPRGFKRV